MKLLISAALIIAAVIVVSLVLTSLERNTLHIALSADSVEEAAIEDFLNEYLYSSPGTRIKISRYESEADLYHFATQKLRGADIVILPAGYYFERLMQAGLEPLEVPPSFPSAALNSFSLQEILFAVPLTWRPSGIFYSRQLLADRQLPDSPQDLFALLDQRRQQDRQALITHGYTQGRLFDLFIALYGNQPGSAVADLMISAADTIVHEDLPVHQALQQARDSFQQLSTSRQLAQSSASYNIDDALMILQRAEALAVFSDSGFSQNIPVDQHRQFLFSPPPLQGPRPPIYVGRLLGAGLSTRGARKPIALALIKALADPVNQEKITSGIALSHGLFAVNSRVSIPSEYARTATRMLAIAGRILPAELRWAAEPDRESLNDTLNEYLLP
ncbi:hypothetical protein JCM12856_06400 [Spirochaeta dissipatitropha]